jgi:hypothetical protein
MTLTTIPAAGITRLLLQWHFHSFLLTIGDTVTTTNNDNPVESTFGDRYHQTLAMPPTVALELHRMLTAAIEEYVKSYGPIPERADGAVISNVSIVSQGRAN